MYLTLSPSAARRAKRIIVDDPALGAAKLDVDSRIPTFVGLGESPAGILSELVVAVVGVGSVGRRVAQHFARLGIRKLILVDPGRFDDQANLVTQEILRADVGGQFKSTSAGRACKSISPQTEVIVCEGVFADFDPMELSDAHYLMLATDNLPAEVDVSRAAIWLGLPVIQASVHGETMVAQVRFAVHRPGGAGPCLACAFGPQEWQHWQRETLFSCTGGGPEDRQQRAGSPTVSTSFLCSMAADLALVQCVRHALDLGASVEDQGLQYCGFTHDVRRWALSRNAACPLEHLAVRRAPLEKPVPECTPRELARLAGLSLHSISQPFSLSVGGLIYASGSYCCGRQHPLRRFVARDQSVGRCTVCRKPLFPAQSMSWETVPASTLSGQGDIMLRHLGAGSARWALVRGHQQGVLFLEPGQTCAPR